jgi:hypothetical protein
MSHLQLSTATLLAAAPDITQPMPVVPEIQHVAEETIRAAEFPILREKPAPRPAPLPIPERA